ncbi:ribonuclease III domain-containing protein [Crucibulum laeve]|uniref:Ribonuclease III domain-containing protein n=1 Tax=Crucibulum laeve TaxID=68775 RepID=A0A5C3M8Q9_9AGAR|nr:ribonuclease III domain-containing protein [Crucibulum laeve]
MSALPTLPKIEGDVDLLLDVFTHHSLRFGGAPMNDDYGDTERLAELGAKVFDLAVTFHLYSKKPFLRAHDIAEQRMQTMADKNLESWLDAYGLKNKLRYAPGEAESVNSPDEIRKFFNTYIGALYIRNGMQAIQPWISRLIDPDTDVAMSDPSSPAASSTQSPSYAQSWSPVPPSNPPPPLPSFTPSSPGSSLVSSLVSLALVNQTAAQKGFQVTYPAEQAGPPHQPTWTVRCCLNGQDRGLGIGKSQKIAKEEAARQAWVSMGWGPLM